MMTMMMMIKKHQIRQNRLSEDAARESEVTHEKDHPQPDQPQSSGVMS